jgi:tripartite-type tricarboxylate transporter receptor subunit TctC
VDLHGEGTPGILTEQAGAWFYKRNLSPVSQRLRADAQADVATFAESGMPGYESTTWYSLAAPAGTPPDVLQRLRQAVHALLDSPEYQALMLAQGSEVMKLSAAESLEFVRRDFRQTDALIKSAKIKIEN